MASDSSVADGTGTPETGTLDVSVDNEPRTVDSADGGDIEAEEIPLDLCNDVDCDDELECTDDTCIDGQCIRIRGQTL